MKEWVKRKDRWTSEELTPWGEIRYFHFLCDHCGKRHPEVNVNEVYPEEGFPREMDLCDECQEIYYDENLVRPEEMAFFTKEYDLEDLPFKSDYNFGYDEIEKLLEVREDGKYLKVTLVKRKGGEKTLVCIRYADFLKKKGVMMWRHADQFRR